MSETASVAKGHIKDLEDTLKEEDFRGPEWDMHRQLLRAAHNTTNGGAGDIRVLSENLGMLTATYVQDRIRQPDQIKRAFAELHGDICPVVPLVTKGEDGKPVMPWDKKSDSVFSFSAEKGISAKGPVAVVVGSIITIAVVVVLGVILLSDKTARKAASETAVELVQEMAKQKLVQTQGD